MRRLLACIALLASLAAAQGARYDNVAQSTTPGATGGSLIIPVPGASITVCPATSSGIPCAPTAAVYSDAALTQALTQPLAADAQGNFGFYIAPGQYRYTITAPGYAGATYYFTIAAGVSGANNLTAQSIEQVRYADQFAGATGLVQLNAAIAAESTGGGVVVVNSGWSGTTANITAATGASNVSVLDMRSGTPTWYTWNGSAYEVGERIAAGGVIASSDSNPCFNWGDSITYGDFASPLTDGYAYLLDAAEGWSCANKGTPGAQMMDSTWADAEFNTSIAANTISTELVGANDMRSTYCSGCTVGMSSSAAQAQWLGTLLADLAWVAISNGDHKVTAQACPASGAAITCTYAGSSWTTAVAFGVAEKTTHATDTVTVNFSGRAFYFVSVDEASDTSTYTLTVDGASVPLNGGTFATVGQITRTFNDTTRNYSPYLIRVGGLSNGSHSVVFTCTAADASDPCYFAWFAAPQAGAQNPSVYVGDTLRAQAAGYAADGGSDAIVGQFDGMTQEAVGALSSDGLNVVLVPASSVMDPNAATTLYHTDGFHPNNAGHALIAKSFEQSVKGLVSSNDRGAAEILQQSSPCTLAGGFAVGGCPSINFQRGDLGAAEFNSVGRLFLGLDGFFIQRQDISGNNYLQFSGTTNQFPALELGGGASPFLTAEKADASGEANFNAAQYGVGTGGSQLLGAASGGGNDTLPAGAGTLALTNQLPLPATTPSIGGSALAAGTCTTGTVAVANSTTSMAVAVSPAADPGTGFAWEGWVSAAGTVTVRLCNITAGSLTPTAEAYNVRAIQ